MESIKLNSRIRLPVQYCSYCHHSQHSRSRSYQKKYQILTHRRTNQQMDGTFRPTFRNFHGIMRRTFNFRNKKRPFKGNNNICSTHQNHHRDVEASLQNGITVIPPESVSAGISKVEIQQTHTDFPIGPGDFILGRKLGSGAYGQVVYACVSKSLSNHLYFQNVCAVAVKGIQKHLVTAAETKNEINVLTSLRNHPNIVSLYSTFHTKKYICIVMEHIRGTTVSQLLSCKNTLSEDVVVKIMTQVFDALAYMHQKGIAHMDIKGCNVMLKESPGLCLLSNISISIIDFGLAQYYKNPSKLFELATKNGRGTPGYMAPEMYRENGAFSASKADIWSAGTLMFELLMGYLPFGTAPIKSSKPVETIQCQIDNVMQELGQFSTKTKRIVLSCLMFLPSQRRTAIELRDMLLDLLEECEHSIREK